MFTNIKHEALRYLACIDNQQGPFRFDLRRDCTYHKVYQSWKGPPFLSLLFRHLNSCLIKEVTKYTQMS